MDLADLRTRVDEVIAMGGDDPESMHYEEDRLMDEVLRAVAAGDANSVALAAEVLRLRDREVMRWYA